MRELPTGTVTFLFTDLEGSTRLWEQHPDAMRDALARHDEILRDAVEKHDGRVVKTTGDGFHAAFETAHDAVDAAVNAQLGLVDEPWTLADPLRVRMGVHTGEGEHRDGDYYGPAINRAARIAASAHGGQILCSHGTEQLVRDALPAGITLVDLGEHRLRDLGRPERLFQLSHSRLPSDFAPVRGLDAYPTNLPLQLTSFVGRDRELAEVAAALDDSRIVTLTGVGGVGKTRLALQVAADVVPRFRDGAWFADLAPVRDRAAVADTVAAALGLQLEPGVSPAARLATFVKAMDLLLVVDNCEHVLDEAASLISALIHAGPGVRVLATSREGLAVSGERIVAVGSLPVPSSDADVDAAAAQLFVERAAAAGSTELEDRAHIAQICRRLDGVPLALELAAARSRSMSLADLDERLDQRFRLLTGGPRDALSRHQTLRQAIDWSYDLLSSDEQLALDRLSVFAGGFDLAAAEAVVGAEGIDPFDVVDLVAHLVEKSLVVRDDQTGSGRYRLLETIRQYAQERLEARSEAKATRRRHAQYFADFVEVVMPGVESASEIEWTARLEREADNLRSAMSWAVSDHDIDTVFRLVDISHNLVGSAFPLFIHYVDDILAMSTEAREHARYTRVLAWAAFATMLTGDVEGGNVLAHKALEANAELGRPDDVVVVGAISTFAMFVGDFDAAMRYGHRACDLARNAGDDYLLNQYLINLSAVYGFAGDVEQSRRFSEESAEAARRCGSISGLAGALCNVGWVTRETDPERALVALDEAMEAARRVGTPQALGYASANAAVLRARAGDGRGALENGLAAIGTARQRGDRQQLGQVMVFLGMALVAAGSPEAAAVLAGAGRAMVWMAFDVSPDGRLLRSLLDDALGEAPVDDLIARGAAMDDEQAVDYARRALESAFSGDGDG